MMITLIIQCFDIFLGKVDYNHSSLVKSHKGYIKSTKALYSNHTRFMRRKISAQLADAGYTIEDVERI